MVSTHTKAELQQPRGVAGNAPPGAAGCTRDRIEKAKDPDGHPALGRIGFPTQGPAVGHQRPVSWFGTSMLLMIESPLAGFFTSPLRGPSTCGLKARQQLLRLGTKAGTAGFAMVECWVMREQAAISGCWYKKKCQASWELLGTSVVSGSCKARCCQLGTALHGDGSWTLPVTAVAAGGCDAQ